LRITEAELARDLHAVLAKVQEGVEVIVEQDHRPVAVISFPPRKGRLLSERIALAKARHTTAVLDEGFMKDVASKKVSPNAATHGTLRTGSNSRFQRSDRG
jgi:antitoxin (DNA-binding transcriptional repressor) of toxin-antitoxin stability system